MGSTLPPTGVSVLLWPWVIWNLWKSRNKLVRRFTGPEIVLKSIKDAREWGQAQVESTSPISPVVFSNHANHRLPCPPPSFHPGVLVCRVNAAWDSISGKSGIGGIFSGCLATSLPPIAEAHNHVSSAFMAEVIAVHRAVSLAVYSNVRSLAVLSDSLSLIKLLKKEEHQPKLFGIMFDIFHFISLFDVISFHFISRNFNSETDAVAKSVLALSVTNPILDG